MYPNLPYFHVRGSMCIAVKQPSRGPDMVREFRQASRWVFVEEEDRIAEEHGCGYGEENEGKPVSRRLRPVLVKCSPQRVVRCKDGRLGRAVWNQSSLLEHNTGF